MNVEFSLQIFEKYSNIKFHENASSGEPKCSMPADTMKLVVAYRSSANATQKR
jgi:hypothetical protein